MYAMEKSFYSEYAAYIAALDAIGYSPEGNRRFYIHAIVQGGVAQGGVTGYAGSASIGQYPPLNSPYTLTFVTNGNTCVVMNNAAYVQDSQTFVAYADGNLGSQYDDIWTINNLKIMSNCAIGI